MASTRTPNTIRRVVMQMKHSQVPHRPRAEELADEAFIPIIRPDVAQYRHRIAGAGNLRKPLAILIVRIGNDAFDILHHRKTERIRMKLAKMLVMKRVG